MRLKKEYLLKAEKIKTILEKEYRKHYTYRELEAMVGIGKLSLQLAFKAVTNLNVYEYLTKIRIENAKYLLQNTDLTVNEIADKVGLHKTNFNKQFKKFTNKTPAQWRVPWLNFLFS